MSELTRSSIFSDQRQLRSTIVLRHHREVVWPLRKLETVLRLRRRHHLGREGQAACWTRTPKYLDLTFIKKSAFFGPNFKSVVQTVIFLKEIIVILNLS